MNEKTSGVAPHPSGAAQPRSGGLGALAIDLLTIIVVSAAISAVTFKFGHLVGLHAHVGSPEPQFLVANVEDLVREEMLALGELVRKGEIQPGDMPVKTARFSRELLSTLQAYADETGKAVLRMDSVVVAPSGVDDVTDVLRKKLAEAGAMHTSQPAKEKP